MPSLQWVTRSVQAARWDRTRTFSKSPNLAPNSTECESPPVTSRVAPREEPKLNPPLTHDSVTFETKKGHLTEEVYGGPFGTLSLMAAFGLGVRLRVRKDISHILSPHRVPRQGSAVVSQSFSEPVSFQIGHPKTTISKALAADLSAENRLSTTPNNLERDYSSASQWT